MESRLNEVVEELLVGTSGVGMMACVSATEVVDIILDSIDISKTCNRFDDLVELIELCDKYGNGHLFSLGIFKKRLVEKIYKERGEEGSGLIKRIMKYL